MTSPDIHEFFGGLKDCYRLLPLFLVNKLSQNSKPACGFSYSTSGSTRSRPPERLQGLKISIVGDSIDDWNEYVIMSNSALVTSSDHFNWVYNDVHKCVYK